jgi:hypothetical protein
MALFRRITTALYRWRIARLDHRLDVLQEQRHRQPGRTGARQLVPQFEALAIRRAVLARRMGDAGAKRPD